MNIKHVAMSALVVFVLALFGCGDEPPPGPKIKAPVRKVQIVNLDKVLDKFFEALDETDLEIIAGADDNRINRMAMGQSTDGVAALATVKRLPKAEIGVFINKLGSALARAKLVSAPVGAVFLPDGTVIGFVDKNRNKRREGKSEKALFKIILDEPRGRVIASDLKKNGYNRDRKYGKAPKGLFSTSFLGLMLNRQQTAGFDTATLGSLKMAPPGYHRLAVRKASGAAPPARPGAKKPKGKK